MSKKDLKRCPKCGEHYFGDTCIGCHSNQYAHYNSEASIKSKIFIFLGFLVIIVLIILNK